VIGYHTCKKQFIKKDQSPEIIAEKIFLKKFAGM
jgi:hypothetical protein